MTFLKVDMMTNSDFEATIESIMGDPSTMDFRIQATIEIQKKSKELEKVWDELVACTGCAGYGCRKCDGDGWFMPGERK